jgi:hypothetical protein
VRGQRHVPAALYPGKDPVPIVQEAGWAQDRCGQVRKISFPPGFKPRTVQPVASRYTDYATRPCVEVNGEENEMSRKSVGFFFFCFVTAAKLVIGGREKNSGPKLLVRLNVSWSL